MLSRSMISSTWMWVKCKPTKKNNWKRGEFKVVKKKPVSYKKRRKEECKQLQDFLLYDKFREGREHAAKVKHMSIWSERRSERFETHQSVEQSRLDELTPRDSVSPVEGYIDDYSFGYDFGGEYHLHLGTSGFRRG